MPNLHPTPAFLKRIMEQVDVDIRSGKLDPDELPRVTSAQRRFLEAYRRTGVMSTACEVAKMDRKNHYDWCKRSVTYRKAFLDAYEDARDEILEACRRVAIDDRNVPMLIHLSKGMFPELFGTQRYEVTGADGGSIEVKSNTNVEQIFGRINDIIRKRQAALDPQPEEPRLLAGPEDSVEHSKE
jgi:hypothetical protein